MQATVFQRLGLIVAFLVMVMAVSVGVWRYGYLQALDQLSQQGEADLALASDRLVGQLERYRELAVLMADHPIMQLPSASSSTQQAQSVLLEVADKTGALDIMFVSKEGVVQASARTGTGLDYGGLDFVRRAEQGALGWGHGSTSPLDERAFYHAAPVFDPSGNVAGAVVVAAGISALEDEWRGGSRPVLFTDQAGEVFITNRSELVGWRRPAGGPGLQPPDQDPLPFDSYETGGHEVWQLGWGPYLPQNALHLVKDLPIVNLRGETLVDVAPARKLAQLQAAAVAALCLAFGALLFLATERRRTLALANAELEMRVGQRTRALSETNVALRKEVTERKEAQAALARAQADLVQAGKLSALGQMSAGISHELNQPLMAIGSFAENAVQFMQRGQSDKAAANLARISDMSRRMGRIIKNLRAFSKQEIEPMTRVDLSLVLHDAIEMVDARATRQGAQISFEATELPIWVRGGEVRLGQVFVNLLANALDAMKDADHQHISIHIAKSDRIEIHIEDTGPGVCDPDKVFDPFYSTKEVGASEGMGLGLSISYGIVKGFGGEIKVRNNPQGALFIVALQPWQESEAA